MSQLSIVTELDGALSEFGTKFWQLLRSQLPQLDRQMAGGQVLKEVSYTDRYLKSPLPVLLLRAVIGAIPAALAASTTYLRVSTKQLDREQRGIPASLSDNWPPGNEQQRRDFLSQAVGSGRLSASWPGRFKLDVGDSSIAHWRELRLTWEDGSIWHAKLDQGFGYWGLRSSSRFPFERDATAQVRIAEQNFADLKVGARERSFPTFVFHAFEVPKSG